MWIEMVKHAPKPSLDAGSSKSKFQSLTLGRSCVWFAATIWHFGLLQQQSS